MHIPLFIGCDLNGPPVRSKEFEPFAYASIVSSKLFKEVLALHNKEAKKEEDQLDETKFGYEEQWGVHLQSAYAVALKGEPAYTTWKKRSDGTDKHTIDYIFYQRSKDVTLSGYLSIPTDKEVNPDTFYPGWEYPSDHVSIMASFEF